MTHALGEYNCAITSLFAILNIALILCVLSYESGLVCNLNKDFFQT